MLRLLRVKSERCAETLESKVCKQTWRPLVKSANSLELAARNTRCNAVGPSSISHARSRNGFKWGASKDSEIDRRAQNWVQCRWKLGLQVISIRLCDSLCRVCESVLVNCLIMTPYFLHFALLCFFTSGIGLCCPKKIDAEGCFTQLDEWNSRCMELITC